MKQRNMEKNILLNFRGSAIRKIHDRNKKLKGSAKKHCLFYAAINIFLCVKRVIMLIVKKRFLINEVSLCHREIH